MRNDQKYVGEQSGGFLGDEKAVSRRPAPARPGGIGSAAQSGGRAGRAGIEGAAPSLRRFGILKCKCIHPKIGAPPSWNATVLHVQSRP